MDGVFDRHIRPIEAINAQNGNVGIALRLFCETGPMNRSDAISPSAPQPAQSGADAAQWVEIYFPGVDDLLRRLVQSQADRQSVVPSLSGSWTTATICVICFICLPGCATAIFLMKSGNFHLLPVQAARVSATANRLPLIQPIHRFGEAQPVPFREISNRADLFEPVALRGSIRNVLLETPPSDRLAPSPPPASARKSSHHAVRATPAKLPVESPQPQSPPRPPSLFEKLFSAILPVSPSPGQT